MTPENGSDAASFTVQDELSRARSALEAAVARAERLQRQRDEAREQRDEARLQRDEAREQRDNLGRIVEAGDPETWSPGCEAPPVAPSAPGGRGGRPRRLRDRAPSGFAALPRSDLPSRAYSIGKYEERENARLRIERRLKPRFESGQPLSLAEREIQAARQIPPMRRFTGERNHPGQDVAFVTVADIAFFPGLLGLVLSLLDVYPKFSSTLFVFHDGSITRFAQERLIDVYPNIEFISPEMEWLDLSVAPSKDTRRIGKLGYMKFVALTLTGYSRVIVLDSDLMILDDISALWTGSPDDARVSFDLGNREFAIKSDYTNAWIINSGVISIPGHWCTPEQFASAQKLIAKSIRPLNDLLDQFADQKVWNIFLSQRETTYVEVNFNCNVKYVGRFLGGKLEGISILHFAGPKPWNTIDYLPADLVSRMKSMSCVFPNMWINRYRTLLFKNRSLSFRRDLEARDRRGAIGERARSDACALTDDASELSASDVAALRAMDVVHVLHRGLPDWFEQVSPRHVVFASHEFLGGWNTFNPELPGDVVERILALRNQPVIWTPYYFKPFFEILARKHGLEVRYLLHEAPFVRQVGDVGAANCAMDGFIDSCGNETLSFGAPIAARLGFKRLFALVGDLDRHREHEPAHDPAWGPDPHAALPSAISLVAEALRENGVELTLGRLPSVVAVEGEPAELIGVSSI